MSEPGLIYISDSNSAYRRWGVFLPNDTILYCHYRRAGEIVDGKIVVHGISFDTLNAWMDRQGLADEDIFDQRSRHRLSVKLPNYECRSLVQEIWRQADAGVDITDNFYGRCIRGSSRYVKLIASHRRAGEACTKERI